MNNERLDQRLDGYALIESYAPIGDGRVVALVARDAAIDWWVQPTMDAPPTLAALLDEAVGGSLTLEPAGPHEIAGRRYIADTAVLETTFRVGDATVRITDSMNRGVLGLLPWNELARRIDVEGGEVRLRWSFAPGGRFAGDQPMARLYDDTPILQHGDQMLAVIRSDKVTCDLHAASVSGEITVSPGTPQLVAVVGVDSEPLHLPTPADVLGRIENTIQDWTRWAGNLAYDGPWRDAVVRSAITLRLLTLQSSGAIMAAGTTSLPETLEKDKNYDYRYSWVRDTSFALDALFRLGMPEEVHASLSWLLATVASTAPDVRVFYSLEGEIVPGDMSAVPGLRGYRGCTPVHVGNSAAEQRQLGAYGDLLDATFRYVDRGNVLNPATGGMIASLADQAARQWQEDDAGLWELSKTRHYTTSKIGCWTALDRSIKLAQRGQVPDESIERWQQAREDIRTYVDQRCWSEAKQSYTFYADSDDLDCSVLLGARCEFFDKGDPRLSSTIDAIRGELTASGPLVYRYTEAVGDEGAFVACTFWLVEALTHVGRVDEARELLDQMLATANDVGIFSEEMDPDSREFRGNTPQALSHLAVIGAATGLTDRLHGGQ